MANFVPTLIRVEHVAVIDSDRGDLVSLSALWTMTSGEQYEATVQLLSHFACASLVVLLNGGQIGPLALLALDQPI
jgi:hypothetical protein